MAHESCNLDKEEAEMLKPSPSPSSPSPLSAPQSPSSTQPPIFVKPQKETPSPRRPPLEPPSARAGNRCSSCEKRVRLAGFRCRCGELFCSRHRHSDTHDCSFDYKAAGREEIGKANPMIRAAKIIKI